MMIMINDGHHKDLINLSKNIIFVDEKKNRSEILIPHSFQCLWSEKLEHFSIINVIRIWQSLSLLLWRIAIDQFYVCVCVCFCFEDHHVVWIQCMCCFLFTKPFSFASTIDCLNSMKKQKKNFFLQRKKKFQTRKKKSTWIDQIIKFFFLPIITNQIQTLYIPVVSV